MTEPTREEIWKSVEDWEGLYEISNHGRIRSLDRIVNKSNGGRYFHRGRVLVAHPNSKGYPNVVLNHAETGRSHNARIHRMVAKAFIPNPDNKPHVNHIDANKSNARASNLEWVTPAENCQHSWRLGRGHTNIMPGSSNALAKLNEELVYNCRQRYLTGTTVKEMSVEFGVSWTTMKEAVSGVGWKHVPFPSPLPTPPQEQER